MNRLRDGLVAGAAGTVALNVVTYLDMAVRGRPSSEVPRELVEEARHRLGVDLPGDGKHEAERDQALGALSGIATGVGVGAAIAVARGQGLRLSRLSGAAVTGLAAMGATDGVATALGVTDPREWSATDWAADLGPHLAYGVVTHELVRRAERHQGEHPPRRASWRLVGQSLLVGVATGARSSLGLVAAACTVPGEGVGRALRWVSVTAVGAEIVADKLPSTPSRLQAQGVLPRAGTTSLAVTALAARERAAVDLPLVVGLAGTATGLLLGAWWRERSTLPEPVAAAVEDLAALALTVLATRRGAG